MPADSTRVIDDQFPPGVFEALSGIFSRQRAAFAADRYPSRETRMSRLDGLIRAIEGNETAIIKAINDDFGNRAAVETITADIVVTIAAARGCKRHLGAWMKPRKVATPLHLAPAASRIEPQPLGVIGIIAPWNYPIQLALAPAAAALAAGNRVMIKPSELTPRTAELLKDILLKEFEEEVLSVATGGVEVGQAFASLPFDHLLFTGSTQIGQKVYEAAARNLTPVTLELGGKSPAVIDESADIAGAALSIAHGKLFNAGQTCIAPDYVICPASKIEETITALTNAARQLYPDIDTTDDYTSIVSDRHFARLNHLVGAARGLGARIVEVGSATALTPKRKLPFTIIVNPPLSADVMQEEIFGPVLPVLSLEGREAAIALINAGERPLALYWFGEDAEARDKILRETVAGGVTVNDTLWHVAQENLPFGGVGKSGIGAYHGSRGFESFSHLKPVFYQSRYAGSKLLYPPFNAATNRILAFVRKLI